LCKKIAQSVAQPLVCQNYLPTFTVKISSTKYRATSFKKVPKVINGPIYVWARNLPQNLATSVIFKKVPKVTNGPLGDRSPNLATLLGSIKSFLIQSDLLNLSAFLQGCQMEYFESKFV
jgi:hypothetical protein